MPSAGRSASTSTSRPSPPSSTSPPNAVAHPVAAHPRRVIQPRLPRHGAQQVVAADSRTCVAHSDPTPCRTPPGRRDSGPGRRHWRHALQRRMLPASAREAAARCRTSAAARRGRPAPRRGGVGPRCPGNTSDRTPRRTVRARTFTITGPAHGHGLTPTRRARRRRASCSSGVSAAAHTPGAARGVRGHGPLPPSRPSRQRHSWYSSASSRSRLSARGGCGTRHGGRPRRRNGAGDRHRLVNRRTPIDRAAGAARRRPRRAPAGGCRAAPARAAAAFSQRGVELAGGLDPSTRFTRAASSASRPARAPAPKCSAPARADSARADEEHPGRACRGRWLGWAWKRYSPGASGSLGAPFGRPGGCAGAFIARAAARASTSGAKPASSPRTNCHNTRRRPSRDGARGPPISASSPRWCSG